MAFHTKEERYREIAQQLREQKLADMPLKHEWIELLDRLSRMEDGQLRETGIRELCACAEQANRRHHA